MGNPIPRRGNEVLQRGTQVLQREAQVLQLHLRRNFRSAVAAHVCSRLLLLSGMSGQAVPKIGQAVPNGDLWPGMSCQECQLLPVACPAAQITTVGRQLRVFPRWVRFVELTVSLRAHLPRRFRVFFSARPGPDPGLPPTVKVVTSIGNEPGSNEGGIMVYWYILFRLISSLVGQCNTFAVLSMRW